MTTNHHTPLDNTKFYNKASDVEAPMGELDTAITTNASGISTNASDISTNASDISTNTSDISTNTSDISTNASDISTNASDISTNTSDISTNTSDISTNTSDISSKSDSSHTHDNPYDIPIMYNGTPDNSRVILRLEMVRSVTFPAGLTLSRLKVMIATTSEKVFSLKKNGTEFATFTFAAAGTTASIIAESETVFAANDILTLVSPAVADATLADLYGMIVGAR